MEIDGVLVLVRVAIGLTDLDSEGDELVDFEGVAVPEYDKE